MRRAARALAALLLAPVAAVLLWLLAAVVGGVLPGRVAAVPAEGPASEIAMIAGPIHYDFAFPLDDPLRERLEALLPGIALRGAEWVLFGWGSRAFYTATGTYADVSPRLVLRAALGDRAVIRVRPLGPLAEGHPAIRRLSIATSRRDALLDGVLGDLALKGGRAVPHPFGGHDDWDRFYEARGRFDALRTCNVWLGRRLWEAGVPFGAWTPTPYAVRLGLAGLDA